MTEDTRTMILRRYQSAARADEFTGVNHEIPAECTTRTEEEAGENEIDNCGCKRNGGKIVTVLSTKILSTRKTRLKAKRMNAPSRASPGLSTKSPNKLPSP